MAFANRIRCYVCERPFPPRQLIRLNQEENIDVLQVASFRRHAAGFPPIDVGENTRICLNCSNAVRDELNQILINPNCLRFNVLSPARRHSCIICNAQENLHRMSLECRVNVFVVSDIYVPDFLRICDHHLDNNDFVLPDLIQGLRFVNKPYLVPNLQRFISCLRNQANANHKIKNWESTESFTEDEFKTLTSISKNNFEELCTFCDDVEQYGNARKINRKHLLTFLIKLRHGITDEFLKIVLNYPSRQAVSLTISNVRLSLSRRFVPNNIGFNAITRDNFIARHVSPFINQLYNPTPNLPKAIVYIDCTYNKIDKSSNFRILRQSYCFYKKEHLVKPEIIVAPDGYILGVRGPYFSDASNNDAAILNHAVEHDLNGIRNWFQHGDIVIVDRGYRDSIDTFENLGIQYYMPSFLPPHQKQFTTLEANQNRIITTTRWVVESRNGHFKTIFKFFSGKISTSHAAHLKEFYLIAGALINRYHPLIEISGTPEIANEMLDKLQENNRVQIRVQNENLLRRNGQWNRLNNEHVLQFPRLNLEYLTKLTGPYHIYLAASYIQDTVRRQNHNLIQIDELNQEPYWLRFRIYSRFVNAAKHTLWVVYNNNVNENREDPIIGYYCTCKSGARTLGTCAHVASVVWFLGYARHQQNIKYPSTKLLNCIDDSGERDLPEEVHIAPEVI